MRKYLNGGHFKLIEVKKTASKVCNNPQLQDGPFLCLDLIYVYILLHDGFGLSDNVKLHVNINFRYIFLN